MVSEMNVETCNIHVGVIKYSSAAMIQFNLGVYDTEDEILQAIQRISFTPARANMAEAIRVVRTQMFNNRNGDRLGLLFTRFSYIDCMRLIVFPDCIGLYIHLGTAVTSDRKCLVGDSKKNHNCNSTLWLSTITRGW